MAGFFCSGIIRCRCGVLTSDLATSFGNLEACGVWSWPSLYALSCFGDLDTYKAGVSRVGLHPTPPFALMGLPGSLYSGAPAYHCSAAFVKGLGVLTLC